MRPQGFQNTALLFARLALSASFLSSVGSRLGLWGHITFADFEAYTAEVNAFMPASTIPFLARAATMAETLIGVALLSPIRQKYVGLSAAVLLGTFGIAMTISSGIKSPLDYSVFSATACALLLSVDADRNRN
jgi:putative oxidoreductase